LKTAKGGSGIAFQRTKRIPRLRPRIQSKVALEISIPGFAVAGTQADGAISVTCDQVTSTDAEKEKADELRKQGHTVVETGWTYAN
jgi:hypothetical protein